jgi:exopolysaccharide biosynthesis protein
MVEKHPRSALGWNKDSYFWVEVDGRQKESVGMTLNELAAFMVELGCEEAMNLDGGGSSTLWFEGSVRNHPCDGYERPVANSLALVRKAAAPRK